MKKLSLLKLLSLAVGGVALVLGAKLQEREIDEAVDKALADRGVLPPPTEK